MNRYLIVLITIALVGCFKDDGTSSTESGNKINLKGQTVDEQLKAVPDVVVELAVAKLNDTTDEQGNFHFQREAILGSLGWESIKQNSPLNKNSPVLDTLKFYVDGELVGTILLQNLEVTLSATGIISRSGQSPYLIGDATALVKQDTIGFSVGLSLTISTYLDGTILVKADTFPNLPARFFRDTIQSVFDMNCTGCHSNQGPGWWPTGADSNGLDLSPDSSYKYLVDIASFGDTLSSQRPRVKPGYPNESSLYNKIVSDFNDVWYGTPMPAGFALINSNPDDVEKIYWWIKAGALDD